MEPFVNMEDWEEEKVVEWDKKDAHTILAACLAGTLGDIKIPQPHLIPWTRTDRTPPPSSPT
jgi:hypothetical protein